MNPAADVWSKVITLMQPDMTATTINTWFDDASAVALEDDRFVLYSPTRFKRDIIATRYVGKIQAALRTFLSPRMAVSILSGNMPRMVRSVSLEMDASGSFSIFRA